MLYKRWLEISKKNSRKTAIFNPAGEGNLTFSELAVLAESEGELAPVVFPTGKNFVVTMLRGWRQGKVICPLETDQKPPAFDGVPAGCAHLKMTSATGGTARFVAFTEEQLAADADNIIATMGLRPEWPNVAVISLAHSYGFSNLVLPLVLHGIPLIFVEAPLPEIILRATKDFSAITLPAVPALWNIWHSANAIPPNIGLAISAGAPLSLALERSVFEKWGLKIHNFYGSTECGGIAYDASEEPRRDSACAGSAMKNVELSINGEGCLNVKSGAAGQTYWPAASAKLRAGNFETSDLAEIRDGKVYLQGRLSDQINVAGRKISPGEIEAALRLHPQIKECLVFGVPSPEAERAETIVACVATDATLAGEALRKFLLEKLPAWQIPREWMFVESLETNQRGKISRVDWRHKFLAQKKG